MFSTEKLGISREATEGMMNAIFAKPQDPAFHERLVENALKTPTATGAAMLADDLFGPDRLTALANAKPTALVVTAEGSPDRKSVV